MLAATCPDCGSKLPGDSTMGMCPNCLLGAALDSSVTDAAADETLVSNKHQPIDVEVIDEGVLGTFGNYELIDEVARGGMGIVYRAYQR